MIYLGSFIRLPFPLFCKFANPFSSIEICKKSSTQAGLREIEERDSSIQNKNNKVEIDSPFQINQRTKHSREKVFGKNNGIYCDVKLQVAPTELDALT